MKWQVFATGKVISALGFCMQPRRLGRLLPLSGGKGHVVLGVQQMPWGRLATDESKMSVTRVKQAKPRNTDISQDDGRRQSLLSPLKRAVNIQGWRLWKRSRNTNQPEHTSVKEWGASIARDQTQTLLQRAPRAAISRTKRGQMIHLQSKGLRPKLYRLHTPNGPSAVALPAWQRCQWWRVRHLGRNMPRRCRPPSLLPTPPPPAAPFQNHLDHREWVNHIRGPEERWEVDSTVTAGVALARLIPLGRGKRGTPSRLRGWERKKHFPRNEFTCMVTQRSWPVDAY